MRTRSQSPLSDIDLLPLSPSGFPSYRSYITNTDPVPTFITVTYTTIHNQLSSYVIHNFMEAVNAPRRDKLEAGPTPVPEFTVEDYCHFLLFRSLHYLALLLVLALCTTYFNLMSTFYLVLALCTLIEGDHVLDGRKPFRWDQLYILSYCLIAFRLLYQLPVFRLSRIVSNRSSVIGVYKVNRDDCLYSADSNGDNCVLSAYAGVVPKAIVIDILIFGVALVMRTLLARREMVFVRAYIKSQRKVAAIRLELISLGMEQDRLKRTIHEQQEAISRLVRVAQLKQLKVARQAALEAAREASGQNEFIAGWEGAGRTLGVRRGKEHDEDAMVRSSIRNHAINQIRFAAIDMGEPELPASAAAAAVVADSAAAGQPPASSTAAAPALFPALPPLGQPLLSIASLHEVAVEEVCEEDEAEALRELRAKHKRYKTLGGAHTIAADTAAMTDGEADDDKPLMHRGATTATSAPAASSGDPPAPRSRRAARDAQEEAEEDPATYRAALLASEFELNLVEARMGKLRRKRVIQQLNRQDEPPLLALNSLRWSGCRM